MAEEAAAQGLARQSDVQVGLRAVLARSVLHQLKQQAAARPPTDARSPR
jgi:hypothetical protein